MEPRIVDAKLRIRCRNSVAMHTHGGTLQPGCMPTATAAGCYPTKKYAGGPRLLTDGSNALHAPDDGSDGH